jgi:hypothetical protein
MHMLISPRLARALAAVMMVILLSGGSTIALAASHRDNNKSNANPPPLHGPGSSHNPIVYHPVHGPGSSHNPIVNTGSKWLRGTVVHDHRNGKNCSYTVGDRNSSIRYHRCERGL